MFVSAVVDLIMRVCVVCSWCEPNEREETACMCKCVLYYEFTNGMNELCVGTIRLALHYFKNVLSETRR